MQVISLVGQKGGAGKSTLVRVLTSAIVAARKRVTILDCDPNRSSVRFAAKLAEFDAPSAAFVEAYGCNSTTEVDQRIAAADASGSCDYCLIDTQGDLVGWIDEIITMSDRVVIPVKVSSTDMAIQLETYAYYEAFREAVVNADDLPPAMLVLNQVKSGADAASKYPVALREVFLDLCDHPAMLKTYLSEQNVYNMIDQGVLLEQIGLRLRAAKRPAGFVDAALEEAKALLAAIDGVQVNG